jgi:hypothetical protein
MEPKQTREFVKLIREQSRLQADIRLLAAILQTCTALNQPPLDWQEKLRLGRLTPEYRNICQQYEPQLAELERSLDASELDRLLDSIQPADFLN